MRYNSIFDEPIRKLEKEFFSTTTRRSSDRFPSNDRFPWPSRSPSFMQIRPELFDRREYTETVESKVDDEEILNCNDTELVLRINCIEFKPEEITVTVEENQLLIEGLQERIKETGKTRRQFSRRITLPENSLTKEMNCTAKLNGLLTISIPRKPIINKNEKIIPIRLERSKSSLNHQQFDKQFNKQFSQQCNIQPNQQFSQQPDHLSNQQFSQQKSDQPQASTSTLNTEKLSRQLSNQSTQTDQ